MRITIGDLFHQQAVTITSLSYTLHGSETTWEINVERDPEMMEVPHHVSVNMQMNLVTDVLPEKGGRFYALTQFNNYDKDGISRVGNNNWLSEISKQNQQSLADIKKEASTRKIQDIFQGKINKLQDELEKLSNITTYRP